MTDPKRWLDEPPYAGSLAQQLIVAGKRLELPPGTVERSLAEFSAGIAAGSAVAAYATEASAVLGGTGAAAGAVTAQGAGASAVGANAASASVASLSGGVLAKWFVVGSLFGAGVSSAVPAVRYATRPEPVQSEKLAHAESQVAHAPAGPPSDLATKPAAEAPEAPLVPDSPGAGVPAVPVGAATTARRSTRSEPRPEVALAPAPSPVLSGEPERAAGASDANRLKLEALELAKAKNLLETGDARGALSVLGESRARFASGAMIEERDALAIEAHSRLGEREQAREAARRFFVRFPKSPLAARVKRWSELE
jgi:hypothetical protein